MKAFRILVIVSGLCLICLFLSLQIRAKTFALQDDPAPLFLRGRNIPGESSNIGTGTDGTVLMPVESDILHSYWESSTSGTGPSVRINNDMIDISIPGDSIDDPSLNRLGAGVWNRCNITGDFDIQVNFELKNWPYANGVRVGLITGLAPQYTSRQVVERVSFGTFDFGGYPEVYLASLGSGVSGITATEDLEGQLRLTRNGSIITAHYYDSVNWIPLDSHAINPIDVGFGVNAWSHDSNFTDRDVELSFSDFTINSGSLDCPQQSFAVQIEHIEVTQGIQNLENSVPLIAHKPTVVRVYVSCAEGCNSTPNVTGFLEVSGAAGSINLPPSNGSVTAYEVDSWTSQRESAIDATLNFDQIPMDILEGDVTFTATVGDSQSTQFLNFNHVDTLRIGYVPLTFNGEDPDPERIVDATLFLENVYPFSDVDYFPVEALSSARCDNLISGDDKVSDIFDCLEDIDVWYEANGWPEPNGRPDHLYGWIHDAAGNDIDGRGFLSQGNDPPERLAYGTDTAANQTYQMIMAHEIGHNLGRFDLFLENGIPQQLIGNICDINDPEWSHDNDDDEDYDFAIHDVGYDFGVYPRINPLVLQSTDDLMIGSHCGASVYGDKWVSAHTYRELYDKLISAQTSMFSQSLNLEQIGANEQVLFISGRVFDDASAELDAVYQIETAQQVTQSAGTEYCLTLEDGSGTTLSSDCFDLSFEDPEWHTPLSYASFNRLLAYDAAASRLVLWHGSSELAERAVSTHAPSVTVLSPNGGETLAGTVDVSWDANDDDGDSLTHVVSYSPNGGQDWHQVGFGITDNHLTVDTATLPGGDQALFKITVTDGMNTSSDVSDNSFVVAIHDPQVSILNPNKVLVASPGKPLQLDGYGYDLEDGLLEGPALGWESDVDGPLGTGTKIIVELSAGTHTITLSATDSDNTTAAASQVIDVGTVTQSIPLIAGWNMISSFVIPATTDLNVIFPTVIRDQLVLCKEIDGAVYWPELDIDQIRYWDSADGYRCYAAEEFTLELTGLPIAWKAPISLVPGWNMVAYWNESAMPVDEALNSIGSNLVLVKTGDGRIYWPEYGINQIGDMQPGRGYQIYLNAPGSLTYPSD